MMIEPTKTEIILEELCFEDTRVQISVPSLEDVIIHIIAPLSNNMTYPVRYVIDFEPWSPDDGPLSKPGICEAVARHPDAWYPDTRYKDLWSIAESCYDIGHQNATTYPPLDNETQIWTNINCYQTEMFGNTIMWEAETSIEELLGCESRDGRNRKLIDVIITDNYNEDDSEDDSDDRKRNIIERDTNDDPDDIRYEGDICITAVTPIRHTFFKWTFTLRFSSSATSSSRSGTAGFGPHYMDDPDTDWGEINMWWSSPDIMNPISGLMGHSDLSQYCISMDLSVASNLRKKVVLSGTIIVGAPGYGYTALEESLAIGVIRIEYTYQNSNSDPTLTDISMYFEDDVMQPMGFPTSVELSLGNNYELLEVHNESYNSNDYEWTMTVSMETGNYEYDTLHTCIPWEIDVNTVTNTISALNYIDNLRFSISYKGLIPSVSMLGRYFVRIEFSARIYIDEEHEMAYLHNMQQIDSSILPGSLLFEIMESSDTECIDSETLEPLYDLAKRSKYCEQSWVLISTESFVDTDNITGNYDFIFELYSCTTPNYQSCSMVMTNTPPTFAFYYSPLDIDVPDEEITFSNHVSIFTDSSLTTEPTGDFYEGEAIYLKVTADMFVGFNHIYDLQLDNLWICTAFSNIYSVSYDPSNGKYGCIENMYSGYPRSDPIKASAQLIRNGMVVTDGDINQIYGTVLYPAGVAVEDDSSTIALRITAMTLEGETDRHFFHMQISIDIEDDPESTSKRDIFFTRDLNLEHNNSIQVATIVNQQLTGGGTTGGTTGGGSISKGSNTTTNIVINNNTNMDNDGSNNDLILWISLGVFVLIIIVLSGTYIFTRTPKDKKRKHHHRKYRNTVENIPYNY